MPVAKNDLWIARVSVSPPMNGSAERREMLRWLNKQHLGYEGPLPKEVSAEHMNAHYAVAGTVTGYISLRLQKDGTSVPLRMEFGGKKYKLTEE